jgi:hypothetical protein
MVDNWRRGERDVVVGMVASTLFNEEIDSYIQGPQPIQGPKWLDGLARILPCQRQRKPSLCQCS